MPTDRALTNEEWTDAEAEHILGLRGAELDAELRKQGLDPDKMVAEFNDALNRAVAKYYRKIGRIN